VCLFSEKYGNPSYFSNNTIINKETEKDSDNKILINNIKVKEESKKTDNNYSKKYKSNIINTFSNAIILMNKLKKKFFDKKLNLQNREIDSKIKLEKYKIDQKMKLKKMELEIQKQ